MSLNISSGTYFRSISGPSFETGYQGPRLQEQKGESVRIRSNDTVQISEEAKSFAASRSVGKDLQDPLSQLSDEDRKKVDSLMEQISSILGVGPGSTSSTDEAKQTETTSGSSDANSSKTEVRIGSDPLSQLSDEDRKKVDSLMEQISSILGVGPGNMSSTDEAKQTETTSGSSDANSSKTEVRIGSDPLSQLSDEDRKKVDSLMEQISSILGVGLGNILSTEQEKQTEAFV